MTQLEDVRCVRCGIRRCNTRSGWILCWGAGKHRWSDEEKGRKLVEAATDLAIEMYRPALEELAK